MKKSIVLLAVLCTAMIAKGVYYPDEELRLKFLYIKNFIKNIEWPKTSMGPEFKIAIYGDKKIYEKISMSNIKPEHANGKSISYYYFSDLDKLVDCQLILITNGYENDLNDIARRYDEKAVLIVCDAPNSCNKGALICFTKDKEGKITFEFNRKAFASSGLEYSSQFMEQGLAVL